MIKRDIPNWDTKPHQPSNPKNWYKVYRKLKNEAKLEMAAGEEKLKAALNIINTNREQNTAQVIKQDYAPVRPTNRGKYVTYNLGGRTGSNRGASTSKMGVLERLRYQARDAASKKMSRPTHELSHRSALVKRAPTAFVEDLKHDHKIRTSPTRTTHRPAQTSNVRAPKPPLHKPPPVSAPYSVMQDREARLKALKSGKQQKPQNSDNETARLTVDFLEDDDEVDDLFDDNKSKLKTTPNKPSLQAARPSPQPTTLKRKAAPSLFMSGNAPKKRNVGGL